MVKPTQRYLTTHNVAEILGVTAPTVIKWVESGRMSAHRTPGGHRRISESEVSRFAEDAGIRVDGPDESESSQATAVSVLIIDRELDFSEMVAEYLQIKGLFSVRHAERAIEAGFQAGRMDPDVILYDVDSVNIDIQFLRRMLPNARVILVSTMLTSELESLRNEIGPVDVVEKPLKLDKLLSIIRSS